MQNVPRLLDMSQQHYLDRVERGCHLIGASDGRSINRSFT